MTEEQRSILKYYDEIFIGDSLDKRVEDYCNVKHLYRLYGNKPVVMREIKTSLKEFAKQETESLSKQLTNAKEIMQKLITNAPDTYSGTNIELQQKRMFSFQDAVNRAQQFLNSEVEK